MASWTRPSGPLASVKHPTPQSPQHVPVTLLMWVSQPCYWHNAMSLIPAGLTLCIHMHIESHTQYCITVLVSISQELYLYPNTSLFPDSNMDILTWRVTLISQPSISRSYFYIGHFRTSRFISKCQRWVPVQEVVSSLCSTAESDV